MAEIKKKPVKPTVKKTTSANKAKKTVPAGTKVSTEKIIEEVKKHDQINAILYKYDLTLFQLNELMADIDKLSETDKKKVHKWIMMLGFHICISF